MINHKHYTYRVTWSEEDDEFIALCAEFPSLSFLADTHEKALKGMVKLISEVVKDMASNDELIPTPFSKRQYSGKFQLRIPPEMHRHIAIEAAEQGVSINRYVSSKLA